MLHVWMSRVTHMNESYSSYEGHMNESFMCVWQDCLEYQQRKRLIADLSKQKTQVTHIWMSHVTDMNESYSLYEWVV